VLRGGSQVCGRRGSSEGRVDVHNEDVGGPWALSCVSGPPSAGYALDPAFMQTAAALCAGAGTQRLGEQRRGTALRESAVYRGRGCGRGREREA
jgi:hypothetical protein